MARGRSVLPLWRLIAGACGRCQTRPLLMLFIKTKSSGRFGSRSRLTTVHAAPARWRLARNFRGQQQTRSRARASGSVLRSSARRWLFSSIWIRSPCLEVKEAELQTETAPSVRKVSLIAPRRKSRELVSRFSSTSWVAVDMLHLSSAHHRCLHQYQASLL